MTFVDQLTGPYVSLAGRLGLARQCPGEPSIGSFFCPDRTNAEAFGARRFWYAGAGRDDTQESAAAAAVGEAFERYCLRDLGHTPIHLASMAQLRDAGAAYLAPDRLAPVLDPVRNRVSAPLLPPPPEDRAVLWVNGVDLATGARRYLPAQYCFFLDHRSRYRPDHTEDPWYLPVSNGAATGPDPAAACLSGLLELVERDAFMLMWYHRLHFPQITLDPHGRLGQRVAAVFGRSRLDLRLIDLSEVHGVPVVIAAARGLVRDRPIYAVGGGAAHSLGGAAWKAARELAGLYAWARAEVAELDAGPPGERIRPDEVAKFRDHVRYYTDPDHQHELAFLFDDGPTAVHKGDSSAPPAYAEALSTLARALSVRGIDAYAVDVTPADARPFGLATFKVVSPQLIPLEYNHQARHLGHPRLRTEPGRRGWRDGDAELAELNHAPHPFP